MYASVSPKSGSVLHHSSSLASSSSTEERGHFKGLGKYRLRLQQIKKTRDGLRTYALASAVEFEGQTIYVTPLAFETIPQHLQDKGLDAGEFVISKGDKGLFTSERLPDPSQINWPSWQVGENALELPETKAGSDHSKLNMLCALCGVRVVKGEQIYRIKNRALWTNCKPSSLERFGSEQHNSYKNTSYFRVRCKKCKLNIGSLYEIPFDESTEDPDPDPNRPFPSCKLMYNRPCENLALRGRAPPTIQYMAIEGSSKQDAKERLASLTPRFTVAAHVSGAANALLSPVVATNRHTHVMQNQITHLRSLVDRLSVQVGFEIVN